MLGRPAVPLQHLQPIAARTNLTGVQVCRRLAELGPDGANMIKPTGKTVVSTSGRGEREWQVA